MNLPDSILVNPEGLSGQNLLITGAAGRIGSAVAKKLCLQGQRFCSQIFLLNHWRDCFWIFHP